MSNDKSEDNRNDGIDGDLHYDDDDDYVENDFNNDWDSDDCDYEDEYDDYSEVDGSQVEGWKGNYDAY